MASADQEALPRRAFDCFVSTESDAETVTGEVIGDAMGAQGLRQAAVRIRVNHGS
jgi:hypothetical protein